jgi:pilus assembly protein Flp/PilA
LRIQHAAALCGCSAALALVALAPATALADNPGNPGHHYGQLSNPGHHYGQLKHPSTHPSPPPIVLPSAPPIANPIPTTHPAAGPDQNVRVPITAPTAATSGSLGALADPAPVVITAAPPVPLREPTSWLIVIVVAALFAAGVVAVVVIVGRGSSYLISRARPIVIPVGLKAALWPRQAGQGMVEYALILVLVSIVVIVVLLTMGNQIANVFSNVVAALG